MDACLPFPNVRLPVHGWTGWLWGCADQPIREPLLEAAQLHLAQVVTTVDALSHLAVVAKLPSQYGCPCQSLSRPKPVDNEKAHTEGKQQVMKATPNMVCKTALQFRLLDNDEHECKEASGTKLHTHTNGGTTFKEGKDYWVCKQRDLTMPQLSQNIQLGHTILLAVVWAFEMASQPSVNNSLPRFAQPQTDTIIFPLKCSPAHWILIDSAVQPTDYG